MGVSCHQPRSGICSHEKAEKSVMTHSPGGQKAQLRNVCIACFRNHTQCVKEHGHSLAAGFYSLLYMETTSLFP